MKWIIAASAVLVVSIGVALASCGFAENGAQVSQSIRPAGPNALSGVIVDMRDESRYDRKNSVLDAHTLQAAKVVAPQPSAKHEPVKVAAGAQPVAKVEPVTAATPAPTPPASSLKPAPPKIDGPGYANGVPINPLD
jgi:hypothetical protein